MVISYLLQPGELQMDMQRLIIYSDGCSQQFKGQPAICQHYHMALRFKVPVWWYFGATSHFKGLHDAEGGHLKHWLQRRARQCNSTQKAFPTNPRGLARLCNTSGFTQPARACNPSAAHSAQAHVSLRWCHVLQQCDVAECSKVQPGEFNTPAINHKLHRMCFFPDGQDPQCCETGCACEACTAGQFSSCTRLDSSLKMQPMYLLPSSEDPEQDVREYITRMQPALLPGRACLSLTVLHDFFKALNDRSKHNGGPKKVAKLGGKRPERIARVRDLIASFPLPSPAAAGAAAAAAAAGAAPATRTRSATAAAAAAMADAGAGRMQRDRHRPGYLDSCQ
jgi:hypothetical protein